MTTRELTADQKRAIEKAQTIPGITACQVRAPLWSKRWLKRCSSPTQITYGNQLRSEAEALENQT